MACGYRVSSEGGCWRFLKFRRSCFFMSVSCPQCLGREFDMTLKNSNSEFQGQLYIGFYVVVKMFEFYFE